MCVHSRRRPFKKNVAVKILIVTDINMRSNSHHEKNKLYRLKLEPMNLSANMWC